MYGYRNSRYVIENYMDWNIFEALDADVKRKVQSEIYNVFYGNLAELKEKIKTVFKELRKEEKIYARMNFSCCGSCASYELGGMLKKNPNKKGYVFYHRQGGAGLEESGNVYIHFSGRYDEGEDKEKSEAESRKIARAMVASFEKHGVNVSWTGDNNTCVLVKVGGRK